LRRLIAGRQNGFHYRSKQSHRRSRNARRHAAPLGNTRKRRADRHEIRLRQRIVWRLHSPCRRTARAKLFVRLVSRRQIENHNDRGLGPAGREIARSLDRRTGAAMRLLSVGNDHGGGSAARREIEAERRGHCQRHDQSLPVRNVRPHPACHSSCGGGLKLCSSR
jgi:hypothetical protein